MEERITIELIESKDFATENGGYSRKEVDRFLDAILSSGMKTSRARAAEIIREGAVAVEHRQEMRTDRLLEEGQLLSVRGFGRIRLREVGSMTRKERLPVLLEIFRKS